MTISSLSAAQNRDHHQVVVGAVLGVADGRTRVPKRGFQTAGYHHVVEEGQVPRQGQGTGVCVLQTGKSLSDMLMNKVCSPFIAVAYK